MLYLVSGNLQALLLFDDALGRFSSIILIRRFKKHVKDWEEPKT